MNAAEVMGIFLCPYFLFLLGRFLGVALLGHTGALAF